ncbi:MAG TPA: sulfur transferase domain-containing protein [Pyrinomonadaceae bacterium]|nr:sulfur transferase domain-containing protein [Pyrinomonadaceae bacterium]
MHVPPRISPAIAIVLLLLCSGASAQDVTSHAELPRFKQVSERLFRGAQPRAGGVQRLAELGINTVINLRGASKSTRAEEAEARKFGLNYYNLSLPNWGRPHNGRMQRILEIIAAPESGDVFVHCKDGLDRTGTVVALHRITHLGWETSDALAEAERVGMRRIQFWMRDYIEDYDSPVHTSASQTTGQFQGSDDDLSDHVGAGVRIAEREVFRVRRILRRLL